VLLIDNYDSFTYNVAQYLSALGAEVMVFRNDECDLEGLLALNPTHVVLSPGPGRPESSGLTIPAVRAFEGVPLLGVCLGLQAIVLAYGGTLARAPLPVHGKASKVDRDGSRVAGDILGELPLSFAAGRYHSLVAGRIPASLHVTARGPGGITMAIQHRRHPTYGVQFHPESMLTPSGFNILSSFLSLPPKVREA
jgi:anthranilate synthase/aminodeoxychorismate synthase-like glutamine amidotransferase